MAIGGSLCPAVDVSTDEDANILKIHLLISDHAKYDTDDSEHCHEGGSSQHLVVYAQTVVAPFAVPGSVQEESLASVERDRVGYYND